jgi:hypothetical protein
VPEDPHRSTHTQAFGQGAEDFPHATGGGLEAIQGRAITDAEFCPTGLAREVLNIFLATVAAAADEGVDLFIGDAVVQAIGVGTGKPGRRNPLLAERAARVLSRGHREWGEWLMAGGSVERRDTRDSRLGCAV